jgi:hypothetical protein
VRHRVHEGPFDRIGHQILLTLGCGRKDRGHRQNPEQRGRPLMCANKRARSEPNSAKRLGTRRTLP